MKKINIKDVALSVLVVLVLAFVVYEVKVVSNQNNQLTNDDLVNNDLIDNDVINNDIVNDDLMIDDYGDSFGSANMAAVYGPYVNKVTSSSGDVSIKTTTNSIETVASPAAYSKTKKVPIWTDNIEDIYQAITRTRTVRETFVHNQSHNEYALPLKVIWVYSNKVSVGGNVEKSSTYVALQELIVSPDGKTLTQNLYYDGYFKPEYKTNPKYTAEDAAGIIAAIKADPAGSFNRFVNSAERKIVTNRTRLGTVGWAWKSSLNNEYYSRSQPGGPWVPSSPQ